MATVYKRVELAANLAILVVALILASVVIKRYFWSNNSNNVPQLTQVKVGDKLAVTNIDWRVTDNTLVLVLQKGCRYCDESADFYQRLVKALEGRSDFRVLAVLPQTESESREYLNKLGVSPGNIVQASPASFGVSGTPTIMLVNQTGQVKGIWRGKLSGEQEAKVTELLRLS